MNREEAEGLIRRLHAWEDSEFWPRILRDGDFWQRFDELSLEERHDALLKRVKDELALGLPQPKKVYMIRFEQAGLLQGSMELAVHMGLTRARARELWQERPH